MQVEARNSRQIFALTGLRGLAAWLVVLFHVRVTIASWAPAWVLSIADKGYLAVDLFFILSGFVIWMNYSATMRAPQFADVVKFWNKRVFRIWPLHAILTILLILFDLILIRYGKDNSNYPLNYLPLNFLLIQNWGFTQRLAWNDPSWSISCEMAAYLLFPLSAAILLRLCKSRQSALAIICGLAVLIWLFFKSASSQNMGADITHTGLVRCVLEFTMGNALCALWLATAPSPRTFSLAMLACAIAVVAGIVLKAPETAFVPLALAALILATALDRGIMARFLSSPVPRTIGEISYSTYLVHFPLFIVFKLAFVHGPAQISPLQLTGFCALTMIASAGLYFGVEKPCQRSLNRRCYGP